MTTTIQVLCVEDDAATNTTENKHRVYYRLHGGEILNVEPNKVYAIDFIAHRAIQNPAPFVEQMVLQYLIIKKGVVSTTRIGADVRLKTGDTSLSRLVNGDEHSSCDHIDMIRNRHLFSTRFIESIYDTDKSTDWIDEGFNESDSIETVRQENCTPQHIDCHHAGNLIVTKHALERFKERKGYSTMSRAWKNLCVSLNDCKWSLKHSFIMDRKSNRVSETWSVKGIRRKPFLVVVSRQGRQGRIVTIMKKENDTPCHSENNDWSKTSPQLA